MLKNSELKRIEDTRIIAIVRGIEEKYIMSTVEALIQGGISVMEVTLNTRGAETIIRNIQREFNQQMYIGAGTVIDKETLKRALDAGASFIVTPNTDEEVIQIAVQQGVPIFPGAMTPTEIVKAWKSGATAVKIFPSGSQGLQYIKELQGPLDHIPMVAVGGIRETNIIDFLNIGCYAVGVGSSLIAREEIEKENYTYITQKAKVLIDKVNLYQQTKKKL